MLQYLQKVSLISEFDAKPLITLLCTANNLKRKIKKSRTALMESLLFCPHSRLQPHLPATQITDRHHLQRLPDVNSTPRCCHTDSTSGAPSLVRRFLSAISWGSNFIITAFIHNKGQTQSLFSSIQKTKQVNVLTYPSSVPTALSPLSSYTRKFLVHCIQDQNQPELHCITGKTQKVSCYSTSQHTSRKPNLDTLMGRS